MSDEAAVLEALEPSAKYLAHVQPALVRGFELLATAHAGIPRLRELILNLAVRGVLVPQMPLEGLAATVLSSARAARAEDDVGRPARQTTRQLVDDIHVERGQLPPGWLWVSGADLFRVVRGVSYEKEQASPVASVGAVPLLRANNIQRTLNFDDAVFVPGGLVAEEQLLRAGDYVICMASGSKGLVGKAAPFLEGPTCTFGAFCAAVRPYAGAISRYLGVFLSSPLYRDEVSAGSAGIGINNLKSSTLLLLRLPLPPLAEQRRIVARVEELMKLCDALEQCGRLADEQHARLTSTLFDALAASESAHALAENWGRIAEHFDLLLDRPEAIDAFEQPILQLAVRGLLVTQVVGEVDSPNFMGSVAAQPKSLHGDVAPVALDVNKRGTVGAEPFPLPDTWQWVRIEEICDVQGGIQKTQLRRPVKNHFPYLRVGNVQRDRLDLDRIERYELTDDEVGRWALKTGDLLIVEGNGSADEVGRCAIWDGSIAPCVFQNHLMRVRPDSAETVGFLKLFLNSPDGTSEMKRLAVTTSGLYNLSVGKIRKILVPLPPLAEQHRIVNRVEELRSLCAQLRERLTDTRRTQTQLADALVAEVVA